MARQIDLSDEDRRFLNEIIRVLGFTQKNLADLTDVAQPWLSQVLTGRRRSVDGEMLEKVSARLAEDLKARKATDEFSDDQARIALDFLTRFTSVALTPRASRPAGGTVPIDARHYVKRKDDDDSLGALQVLPFSMIVRGPAQCGKSSLLARLEFKAREIGIETAWFDPTIPIIPATDSVKQQASINAIAASDLGEYLQAQWDLDPPRDGTLDSIAKVFRWLSKALAATRSKPRLLIFDDIARLGAGAIQDWLSRFVRPMQKEAAQGLQLSIAVGMTYQFGPEFERWLVHKSSDVYWSPRVLLDWFDSKQSDQLEQSSGEGVFPSGSLYKFFAGQPYLTHAAAVEPSFRDAVRRWTEEQTPESAENLRSSLEYTRHLNSIKFSILGPSLEANDDTRKLLKAFLAACSQEEEVKLDADHKQFLETARLLNENGEPKLEIYKLMAGDLAGLSGGK